MKVSIVVASCGRANLLEEMYYSLDKTTQGYDLEIVSIIDYDVVSMDAAKRYSNVMDFSSSKRGAMWAWNRGLQISTGDIIVPAGDDQWFHPGWLDYALESHHSKLDDYGVVGMNDLAYDGNIQLATMLLFDRKYCKEVMGGVICPPVYNYYCVDSEWNAKAKQLNKFYWDERAKVEHLHSAHGKRPHDDLDAEKENAGWMEIDNQIFEQRKALGFPITWNSMI